ncbi:DIP1984 family protein [Paenibacillus sp. N1-5-1-14]|uniref:DIP1984 family protein n=1 Tax=Paenibacillus radicibacter TaxID=2972488 RepID=UPI00215970C5|nr:DIP1984 family protein [Paenibacillus radicibacter]MCR8644469.1 DIP1984 family protein [Paenibacillus radicibacter]
MRLAEALVLRADCQKRIAQLKQRLERVVKVQEGETPAEDSNSLLAELEKVIQEHSIWVRKVNKTNSLTPYDDKLSLTDALAQRDQWMQHRKILSDLLDQSTIKQERYSRSEVVYIRTIDVAAVQKQVDDLSKEYREIDLKIQELNWTVDLIEE